MSLTQELHRSPQQPDSAYDLAPAERFIVWSFRRWVLGLNENNGGHWSMVWNEFAKEMGARDGKAALSDFASLIRCLQLYARRKVYHHQPCCPCLGADEIWMFCLVSACQNQRPQLARSLAEWMVEPDGAAEIIKAATGVAQMMGRHALNLPVRTGAMPAGTDADHASVPARVH